MTRETIEVHFFHPRLSRSFTADVSPECTGQQAIEGLVEGDDVGPFIEPSQPLRPYELVIKRTQRIIHPEMTFQEAGVVNGDVIEVRQLGQGARLYEQVQAEE
jgi:hypothetical protein